MLWPDLGACHLAALARASSGNCCACSLLLVRMHLGSCMCLLDMHLGLCMFVSVMKSGPCTPQGAALRLSTSTLCTDRFADLDDWEDFLEGVRRVPNLAPRDSCQAPLCSPTAADRGVGLFLVAQAASCQQLNGPGCETMHF